jgi:hypothetical protein
MAAVPLSNVRKDNHPASYISVLSPTYSFNYHLLKILMIGY